MRIQRHAELGNVLWFILIAVALLAALTMVLSRSGSTVDQSGDFEQQRIKASEVLRYSKSIESGIEQLRLRGVSENDISLWHDSNGDYTEDGSDAYYNANCTTTDCKLFNADGAGLVYASPPSGVNDASEWVFTATNDVADIGTAAPELLIILPNITTGLCAEINRLTGASYAGTETDVDFTPFTGTYTATESIDLASGQEAGCINYDNGSTTEPFFYQVLIKR